MTDETAASSPRPSGETLAGFVLRGFRGTRGLKGVHPPLDRLGLPGWAWRALAWALAAGTLALLTRTSWACGLFFVVLPLLWLVHRRLWAAVLAHVVFGAGLAAVLLVRGVEGWWLSAAVMTLVNLVSGTWVTWVQIARYDAVVALADRERVLSALARARDELAAAERAAGIAAEHKRWAREVHNTLVQGFISVIAIAQAARGAIDDGEAAAVGPRLAQLEAIARDNLAEARALTAGEGPSALRDGDLAQALRRLVDAQRERGLSAVLDLSLSAEPSPAAQVAVLRIVQEGLSNVARHARAERVEVAVWAEAVGLGRELVVTVVDDGVGTWACPERTGIIGMRSRVEALGGTLTVDPLHPSDGRGRVGTVIEVRMPLCALLPSLRRPRPISARVGSASWWWTTIRWCAPGSLAWSPPRRTSSWWGRPPTGSRPSRSSPSSPPTSSSWTCACPASTGWRRPGAFWPPPPRPAWWC